MSKLLDALEIVRRLDNGEHLCRCPGPMHANGDKHPSLSVKVAADGTTLLRCHAGCTALEIVQSVGLTLADLFPESFQSAPVDRRRHVNARETLKSIAFEATVLMQFAERMKHRPLTDAEHDRLVTAASRINRAKEHSVGSR